jgi:phage terminase large subunit-like protein
MKRIRYDEAYNPIVEYYEWINNHRKRVSLKVYKVYTELVRLIGDPDSEWEYDPRKANHAMEFVENYCHHSKGKSGGQPFMLELWEKALLSATFGIVHKIDGTRKFQEVLLMVGRKNGKSTLSAAVGLYLQIADGEPGAEVYACATKKDQAKIIWLEAKRMVRKSSALAKRIKTLVAELVSDFNDSFFRFLGRDSDSLDGLNVHGAMLDEIHAWTDPNLYDVIIDGMSSREQPLSFITTTAGTVRENVFDSKYEEAEQTINGYLDDNGFKNERFLPIIYELDHREEWTKEESWYKANPGLGSIKKLDTLNNKVLKAKNNPKLLANLLCKDFNIRETVAGSWLNFEDINNEETFNLIDFKGTYAIGGIDLSSTTDLTCATLLWAKDKKFYVNQMYFIPSEKAELREREDKVPYSAWEKQGYVTFTEGAKVDYSDVTKWFVEMRDVHEIYPLWVGYDNWNAQYFTQEMENSNFVMEQVIQGAKTMSPAMKQMEGEFASANIIYNNNPVLKWCLTNTPVKSDDNNNIRPVKGRNTKKRIDGTVSLIDSFVVYMRHHDDYHNLVD